MPPKASVITLSIVVITLGLGLEEILVYRIKIPK